jgi:hypothetical protein
MTRRAHLLGSFSPVAGVGADAFLRSCEHQKISLWLANATKIVAHWCLPPSRMRSTPICIKDFPIALELSERGVSTQPHQNVVQGVFLNSPCRTEAAVKVRS